MVAGAVSETERLELTKAYVALSNAHRVELVLSMFAEDASYHSPNVGVFDGKNAIGDMMREFFSRFPDVHWHVGDYESTPAGSVRFKFVMVATEAETGKRVQRSGAEEIEFSDDGFIRRLEVLKPSKNAGR